MENILTVPIDRPRRRPMLLVATLGLTALLYLTIAAQLGSAVGAATGTGG